MRPDNAVTKGQADARAIACLFSRKEGFENPLADLVESTGAVVIKGDLDLSRPPTRVDPQTPGQAQIGRGKLRIHHRFEQACTR